MKARLGLGLGLMLGLCACGLPQKVDRMRQDKARLDQQLDERSAYDRCNQTAMPGTPQHLACRAAGNN